MALLKYSKEDEMKIRQLSIKIEKTLKDIQKRKADLSAEVIRFC